MRQQVVSLVMSRRQTILKMIESRDEMENQMESQKAKVVLKEIISWVLIFAITFGAVALINIFILYTVKVPTPSMEKTIMTGDKVMTSRLSYKFSEPERGDVIVFSHDPEGEVKDYIKRVIGLPGETLECKDGLVYINSKAINETYLKDAMMGDFGPIEIPDDCYFVMGDNRNNSLDARFWSLEDRFIKGEQIKGKAFFIVNRFKTFPKPDYEQ